jgi:hypothetical protein
MKKCKVEDLVPLPLVELLTLGLVVAVGLLDPFVPLREVGDQVGHPLLERPAVAYEPAHRTNGIVQLPVGQEGRPGIL